MEPIILPNIFQRLYLKLSVKNKITIGRNDFQYFWCLGKKRIFISYTDGSNRYTGPI